MSFELGLAVATAKSDPGARQDTWFVFETMKRRVRKSLSDLDGTEVYVHGGTVDGVFRQLVNAFVRSERQPSVQHMQTVFDWLNRSLPQLKRKAGGSDLFSTRVFLDSVATALEVADLKGPARTRKG